tara:strand:+ start:577 stop:1053 length:477 start_codon:yes stop_codon:yes gene_type:complete
MKYIALLLMLTALTGCSFKQFYPTIGATVGGATGAALGGPGGAAVGAAGGGLTGEILRGNEELTEAKDTIEAISKGDVETLLKQQAEKNGGLFAQFTATIKNILIVAGVCLAAYLAIPIFVARQCSKSEVIKSLTRAPFPARTVGTNNPGNNEPPKPS